MPGYRLKFYGPVAMCTVLIISLSSLRQATVSRLSPDIEDFILHAIEYNIYGLTWIWAILKDQPLDGLRIIYRKAVFAAGGFGILDEYYQSFVPGRHSTWEDVMADFFGAILSILSFWLLMKYTRLDKWRLYA